MQTLTDFLCRKRGCDQWIRVVFRHTDWDAMNHTTYNQEGHQWENIKINSPRGDIYTKVCSSCGAEYTFYPELKLYFSMKEGEENTLLADGKD